MTRNPTETATTVSRETAWNLAVTAFIAAPLFSLTPWWLPVMALSMAGWEILAELKHLVSPIRAVRLGIFAAAIFAAWGEFGGMAAMPVFASVALFAVASFLMIPRSPGQKIWLGFLSCFLLTAQVIVLPSWRAFGHSAVGVILVTSLWVGSASPAGWSLSRILANAAVLLLFGSPFMLFLMLVFPRFGGGGWWEGSGMALTGITDSLFPGNITRLVRDPRVAFRVEFADGYVPNAYDLYWRGLVLWDTDGLNWFNFEPLPERKGGLAQTGVAVPYEVLLEPQMEKMLYALEPPAGLRMLRPSDVRVKRMQGDAFEVPWNLFERLDYRGLFTPPVPLTDTARKLPPGVVPLATLEPLADDERARALHVPTNTDSGIANLAESWLADGADTLDIIAHALAYFKDGGFVYTLEPGREIKSVADFVFRTKRGFCGHFAAGLALLLRSAGIPARVVLGYQGGGYNRWAGYWLVRQHHAHAWVEAWAGDARGWVRADAVRVVAPARIEEETGWERWIGGALSSRLLRKTAEFWDGLGFAFNRIAVRQRSALAGSGNGWLNTITASGKGVSDIVPLALGSVVIAVIAWLMLRSRRRSNEDVLVAVYGKFCLRLARRGIAKNPHEGPLAYAERLACKFPAEAEIIGDALLSYARLRYGGRVAGVADIRMLRARLRRLRLG